MFVGVIFLWVHKHMLCTSSEVQDQDNANSSMGRERLRCQQKSDFLGMFRLYRTHWDNAGFRKRCCYYISWGRNNTHPESETWTLLGSGIPALTSQESALLNKLNVRCGYSPFAVLYLRSDAAKFPKFTAQREEIRKRELTLERRV